MRRHKSDRSIGILTIILLIIGLVVIYAIGPLRANFSNATYGTNFSENYFFIHQLVSVGLAILAFLFAFLLPYEKFKKVSWIVLAVGIVACLVLQIAVETGSSIASCQLGECRWINVGSVATIQPAEILKLGLVLYIARLVVRRKEEGKLEKNDFFIPFSVVSLVSILFVVYFQGDLGSTVIIVAILLAILFTSGMKLSKIGVIVLAIAVGGVFSILISPHRMERVKTFFDSSDADSYHIDNALLAIGSGGAVGVGVGNAVQATGYLPESISDSIFAVMGETFGFLGLAVILIIFTILLYRILRTAEYAGNEEQGLVAIGIFGWILAQLVVNIAAMTGLVPLTGITLPLLSYGGTSILFISFGLGLVLQLSCYSRRKVKEEKIKKISQRGERR